MPSHYQFNYFFDDNQGITFRESDVAINLFGDMMIYYDTLDYPNYIDCRCSRWDVDNYSIVIETWLKKDDLQILISNIVPGATDELYKILGQPTFYDRTWGGNNTLRIYPLSNNSYIPGTNTFSGRNTSNLASMRDEKIIYIKNITTSPIGNSDWIFTKLEGNISGSQL